MKFLSQFAAWRWLAYLVVLPLMVIDEACRGIRLGFDLWCALVQQHEAGHRRRAELAKPQSQEAIEQATVDLQQRVRAQMPDRRAARQTIGPFPATSDIQ